MAHTDTNISDEISVTTEFDLDGLMVDYFNNLPDSPTGTAASNTSQNKIYRTFTATPESLPFHSHGSSTENGVNQILDGGGFDSPEAWRLTNGVHMEVQENAKVSTVNYNIDRSNSTTNFHQFPEEIQHYVLKNSTFENNKNKASNTGSSTTSPSGVDDAKNLKSDSPLSMGFFLRKEGERGTRGSFNLSYANVGVLKNDLHTQRYRSTSDVSNTMSISGPQALANALQGLDNNKLNLYVPYLKDGGVQQNASPTTAIPAPTDTTIPVTAQYNERNSDSNKTDKMIADLNTVSKQYLLEMTGGIDIDPTPLSEIKRRHSPKLWPNASITETTDQPIAPINAIPQPKTSSGFQFYVPRPSKPEAIPKTVMIPSTQPTSSKGNPSVAIAANLIAVNSSIPRPAVTTIAGLVDNSMATTINMNKVPHHHDHLRTVSRQKPISDSGINSNSVRNEQMKKSQYGFGSKHVVPAVPVVKTTAPKRPSKTYTRRNSIRGKDKTTVQLKQQHPTSGTHPTDTTFPTPIQQQPHSPTKSETLEGSSGHGTIHDAAYERKKARAKNARVMINDSIDRLSVVISVAGTQSKERGDQIIRMKQEKQNSLNMINISNDLRSKLGSVASNGSSSNNTGPTVSNSVNMQNSISRCVDISVSAKKWDRPGFIGSAASMIQAMNDHCESLMNELITYHGHNMKLIKYLNHTRASSSLSTTTKPPSNNQTASNNSDVHCGKHSLDDTINSQSGEKRARTSTTTTTTEDNNNVLAMNILNTEAVDAVRAERKVMNRIMQFLNSSTKVTCLLKVSKAWRKGDVFDTATIWSDLCCNRFGSYNLRQWMDKIDSDHTIVPEQQQQQQQQRMKSLYWQMNDANVMPRFSKTSNMFYLGEGRIPGKALAWTFVVDRSNGETMRTVRCPPGTGSSSKEQNQNQTRYTSMPVVQLWTIVQNIAIDEPELSVIVRDHPIVIDSSTRRRKDEMIEITWDDRLRKRILDLDGNPKAIDPIISSTATTGGKELCRLSLFEAVIIETSIHAKGCGTTSKFIQKSNYTQLLVQVPIMTTVPLVIPFPRDSSHLPLEFDARG
jgi:hypothetical protein